MTSPITRVTLFVPGSQPTLAGWSAALRSADLQLDGGSLHGAALEAPVEVEFVANDGGFGAAFSFGTVVPELVQTIDAAPGALVLHFTEDLRRGRAQLLTVVRALDAAGGLAVRLEQSKVGWDISSWQQLMAADDPWAQHRATIAFVGDAQSVQSCGMHAFSLPDVYLSATSEAAALRALGSALNVYQLAEEPLLRTGHTFAPDAETPRRVLERWPDTLYAPGHACHNPFGVWRLGPPGEKGRPMPELMPVFMPPLVALLTALEAKNSQPLLQAQVERARNQGTCVMMDPREAQELERSRGYADLEPDLAWEQWQMVRAHEG